jgi:hypothetical protein
VTDALPAIQRAMSQQPYAKRLQVTVGSDVFFLPRDVARQIEREMLLAAPFVLIALASRSPVIDATDCAGADEGGVAR